MEQAYTAFSNGKTCTFDNFKRALERCRKRGALRNVPLRPNQINQPQLTYRFLDEHVQQFFVWRAVPSIRRWACDISVFRFYIRRVTAGLRTCMPAVSKITLTTWYFYDPFMHLYSAMHKKRYKLYIQDFCAKKSLKKLLSIRNP